MEKQWKCAGRCDSPRTFPYCAHPQRGGTGLFLRLLPHPQLHSRLPRHQQMGRGKKGVLAWATGSHFGVGGEQIIQRLGWGDYKDTHGPLLLNPAVGHLLRSALWNSVVLTAQVYAEIRWYMSMAFLPMGDYTHLCCGSSDVSSCSVNLTTCLTVSLKKQPFSKISLNESDVQLVHQTNCGISKLKNCFLWQQFPLVMWNK